MTKSLNLEQLKAKAKAKCSKVELPGIGDVYAKQWLVAEADEISAIADDLREAKGEENRRLDAAWRALVIKHSICESDGTPLFNDDNIGEYEQFPQEVVNGLVKGALTANGMGQLFAQVDENGASPEEGDQSPN